MSGPNRRDPWHAKLAPDADAMAQLNRALDMARRRLRYRVGATLIIAATLVGALLLTR